MNKIIPLSKRQIGTAFQTLGTKVKKKIIINKHNVFAYFACVHKNVSEQNSPVFKRFSKKYRVSGWF